MPPARGRLLVRFLAAYLGVVLALLVVIGLPLHLALRRDDVARTAERFGEEARLLRPALVRAVERGDAARLGVLCDELSGRFGGRVTLLDAQGGVLADAVGAACGDPADPACLERLGAGRLPETGTASEAIALPVALDGGEAGRLTLRLTLPLAPLLAQRRRIEGLLAAGALAGAALAAAVGVLLARRVARPIVRMTQVAEAIAGGDFSAGVQVGGRDEIARLAGAIEAMRRSLQANVAQLARERNQALAIVQHMTEGVLALDAEGRVLFANAAFGRLMALPDAPAPGVLLESLPLDARAIECAHNAARSGRPAAVEIGNAEPGERIVRLAAGPVPERDASAGVGVVLVVHDVTASRRIESMGRELVAHASHELRTPLALIASAAETLESHRALDPALHEFAAIISRHAHRLGRLVEETLQLARLDALAGAPAPETLDAAALCEDTLSQFAAEAQKKGLCLEFAPPQAPVAVRGDAHLLSLALRNLLDNAIRHARSTVRVRVFREGSDAVIEVADDGPGVHSDDLPHLFERFYRGRGERTGEGVGLGLAIVQRIARVHGGRATADGAPGRGAAFRLHLPIPDEASEPQTGTKAPAGPTKP